MRRGRPRLADERVDVGADVGLAVAHVEVQRLVVVGVVEIGVVDLGGFESFAHATHPVLAERVGHGGLRYVEQVGDVGLLGAFLGEFHDLLAAFLTRHAARIHMLEFTGRVTDLAFCGSNASLSLCITDGPLADAEKGSDATVA